MKPIAVLSLILLAVGALVLALVSVLGGGGGRGTVVDPTLSPPTQELAAPGDLEAPQESRSLAEQAVRKELPQVTEEGRPATGYIRGMVVAPDGVTPLERAQVGLIQGAAGSEFSEAIALVRDQPLPAPMKMASTDGEGRFRFDGLSPDLEWSLRVTHADFAEGREQVDLNEEGGTEVRITLQHGLALTGTVRAALNGAPIPGASVALVNMMEAYQFPVRPTSSRIEVRSDEQGHFEFANLAIGEKVLMVTAPGFGNRLLPNIATQMREGMAVEPEVWRRNRARQTREMAAQPQPPIQIDVELGPGMQIAGRAIGPDRSGVEGVQIQAISYVGETASIGNTVSRAGGEFLIEDLAEGIYSVRAQIAGYDCVPLPRVEAGSTDVELLLALQAVVMGRVLDAETGKPVEDFTCRVRTLHPQDITWGGVVAKQTFHDRSSGTFTLPGIPQNELGYVVEAFSPGYASSFSEPFQVVQGVETQNVDVKLTRGGTIKGRVADTYTGRGVAGALVKTNENNYIDAELMQIFNAMAQSASTKASARTGEGGEFELTLLTPGRYQVVVDLPGFSELVLNDVNVIDGAATDLGDLRLVKGAIVEGIVYGPEGETIAGASVTLQPTDNVDMWSGRNGRSDANGHFILRNTKSGAYKLYATRPQRIGANPFEGAVDMSHSTQEIVVTDGETYEFDLHLPPMSP